MKCDQIQELLLTEYVDGLLKDDMKRKIDEHIGHCPACLSFKQAVMRTAVDVFKDIEREKVPDALWGKIESSLVNEPQSVPEKGSWWDSIRSLFVNPMPVCAAAVLLFFMGVGTVNQWKVHQVTLNQHSQEFLASVMNASSTILINDDEDYGTNVEQVFL